MTFHWKLTSRASLFAVQLPIKKKKKTKNRIGEGGRFQAPAFFPLRILRKKSVKELNSLHSLLQGAWVNKFPYPKRHTLTISDTERTTEKVQLILVIVLKCVGLKG